MKEFNVVQLTVKGGRVIRTIRFNPNQIGKIIRHKDGAESYNLEGAKERMAIERDRWQASDQFIGESLTIKILERH